MCSGCGATMVRERATKEETRPATMLCERAIREEYCVVVEFPKSFSERCASVKEHCVACVESCPHIFLALFAFAFYWCFWWILTMAWHCHQTPGLGLEELTIRDMVVYQNSTTDTTWLVRSDIHVNPATWNPNTMSNCFTTYRRMVVHVDYKGQLLLQQEVPLGFKLKPQEKRPVVMELQGDGYAVQQQLTSLLQRELRKARVVELQFSFDTRFSRNDKGRVDGHALQSDCENSDEVFFATEFFEICWRPCSVVLPALLTSLLVTVFTGYRLQV